MCKTRNFISPPVSAPYKASLMGFLLCKVVEVLLNPKVALLVLFEISKQFSEMVYIL